MKKCFKCGLEKLKTEFYKHPQMGDGLLGKCKECSKSDTRLDYQNNRDRHREYERIRLKSKERKKKMLEYSRKRRRLHPEKTKCYNAVKRAIENGTLIRKPCESCGDKKTQAHHDDYSKPLQVRWFCFKHHREIGHSQKVG